MSKQSRGDKGEQKVISVLNEQKEYAKVINNLTLDGQSGMTHQIDHIYICDRGVFVIESKSYYGKINVNLNDSIWIKEVKNKRERMPNPITQNKSHVRIVKRTLNKDYPIVSVVVFTLNNAPYFPNENVINLDDLSLFLQEYPLPKVLNKQEIDNIESVLLKHESYTNMDDHLNNIKAIKKQRIESHKEIAYALENRKCPRCQSPIIEKKNNLFSCTKCDFYFHL